MWKPSAPFSEPSPTPFFNCKDVTSVCISYNYVQDQQKKNSSFFSDFLKLTGGGGCLLPCDSPHLQSCCLWVRLAGRLLVSTGYGWPCSSVDSVLWIVDLCIENFLKGGVLMNLSSIRKEKGAQERVQSLHGSLRPECVVYCVAQGIPRRHWASTHSVHVTELAFKAHLKDFPSSSTSYSIMPIVNIVNILSVLSVTLVGSPCG